MGDRVRICVAGVGREGIAHARNFRWRVPGAVLEAVVDAEPQRAAWAAEDLDLEGRNHIGLEAALDARGIDAVVNTTPWFTPRRVDAHGGGYLSGIIYGSWPGTLPENAEHGRVPTEALPA